MSSSFSLSVQELETKGWTLIEENFSERLLILLERHFLAGLSPKISLVRQAFDGSPMRLVTTLIGDVVLSSISNPVLDNWHRGRVDTIASGAPASFVPGFDLMINLSETEISVRMISGSGRLPIEADPERMASCEVVLNRGDLVIFDSRLFRKWYSIESCKVFGFSIVREWIKPADDLTSLIQPNAPPRALSFYGVKRAPSRSIRDWIFQSHSKKGE